MERLVKGLVHVAIDAVEDAVRDRGHGRGGGGGDDDDEAPRRGAPQCADGEEDRGERSRSTWAEVRATRRWHLRTMKSGWRWPLGLSELSVIWL